MGGSDDGDAHTTIDISANFGVGFLPLLCEQAESLFRRILASLLLRLIPSVVDSTSSSSIQFSQHTMHQQHNRAASAETLQAAEAARQRTTVISA